MKAYPVFLDSFSGPAAELPPGKRTPDGVLAALRLNPRISTWDMVECAWLRGCIDSLKRDNLITEDRSEPYPWHRYVVIEPDVNCMRSAQDAIDVARAAMKGDAQ